MASTARLDELKKKFDENPRRYFAPLANELRKSGDLEQAIALCRTHLPQQPAHISGHIVLGQALFEAGHLDESRETFHTALELDPENLIALRYLGDIARTGGDIETARSWYQRVLEVDPRNDEIEDLLRTLDAPPAEAAAVASADHAGPAATAAAAPTDPAAHAPQPEPSDAGVASDDPRFAPLTIDEIGGGSDLFAASASEQELTADTSAHGAEANSAPSPEATAGWSSESRTAEMPALDIPELDPFDMPASATADALFEGSDASSHESAGSFLDELTTPNDPVDIGDLEAAPTEPLAAWDATPDEQSTTSTSFETPSAGATEPEFEEGSFYLEPPPATPEWSKPVVPEPTQSAGYAAEDGTPAQAEAQAPAGESPDAAAETMSWEAPADAVASAQMPNVEASMPEPATADAQLDAEISPYDAPTEQYEVPVVSDAGYEAPASSSATPDDGLGLEVMEFVPPASSNTSSTPRAQVPADPLEGHTPELSVPSIGAPPDAFVTETMAELYLQQGFTNEALAVYRELLARNPDDASLRERIEQIEKGSMSSLGIATLSENVVESARKRQTERPTRSVRSFFASLAARRAPAPQSTEIEAYTSSEAEGSPTAEADAWQEQHPDSPTEPTAAYDLHASMPTPDAEPAAPMPDAAKSAAEQMATFDPFADAWGAAHETPTPNDIAAPEAFPGTQPSAAQSAVPEAPAPPQPESVPLAHDTGSAQSSSAPRSLEELFPESSPTPRADAAAQTLATAFGRTEPPGRPTRAASSELSLDHVFREAPEPPPPPPEGGFSFDQFFSDAPRAGGGDAGGSPGAPGGTGATDGDSGDAHDIEQFTAWLEGLKKK